MGDVDPGTLTETARKYGRLRRRYRRSLLGLPAIVLVVYVFAVLLEIFPALSDVWDEDNSILRRARVSLACVGCCACWLGSLVTHFRLMGFRCPKCGGLFVWSCWNSWPSDRCKRCGLDLGPAVEASAKPAPDLDLMG